MWSSAVDEVNAISFIKAQLWSAKIFHSVLCGFYYLVWPIDSIWIDVLLRYFDRQILIVLFMDSRSSGGVFQLGVELSDVCLSCWYVCNECFTLVGLKIRKTICVCLLNSVALHCIWSNDNFLSILQVGGCQPCSFPIHGIIFSCN